MNNVMLNCPNFCHKIKGKNWQVEKGDAFLTRAREFKTEIIICEAQLNF